MLSKKARLRKTADKLWFEKTIKERCEVCGSSDCLQVHHFYYKGSFGHLRYDIDNGITLCRGCHFVLHHQDPKKIEDVIRVKKGGWWDARLKKRAYCRPSSSFLTIKYYQDKIKELERPLQEN